MKAVSTNFYQQLKIIIILDILYSANQAQDKSRRRTISFSLPNEAGDDIVSTSFGPVVVPDIPR